MAITNCVAYTFLLLTLPWLPQGLGPVDLAMAAGQYYNTFASKMISAGFMDVKAAVEQKDYSFTNVLEALKLAGPFHTILSELISLFTSSPKPDSPELKALKEGFKEMGERFDRIDRMLETMLDKLQLIVAAEAYRDKRAEIGALRRALQAVIQFPNDKQALQRLYKECLQTSTSKIIIYFKDHASITLPGSKGLIRNIFDYVDYDLKEMKRWYGIILSDLVALTDAHHACIGFKWNATPAYLVQENKTFIETEVEWTQSVLKTMVENMESVETKLKNEFANFEHAETTRKLEKHKEISHEEFAEKMYWYFTFKYFWLHWAVASYSADVGSFDNHFISYRSSEAFFFKRQHGRSFVVMWCDTQKVWMDNLNSMIQAESLCTKDDCSKGGDLRTITKNFEQRRGEFFYGPAFGSMLLYDCPGIIGKASSKFFLRKSNTAVVIWYTKNSGCIGVPSDDTAGLCGSRYFYILAYNYNVSNPYEDFLIVPKLEKYMEHV